MMGGLWDAHEKIFVTEVAPLCVPSGMEVEKRREKMWGGEVTTSVGTVGVRLQGMPIGTLPRNGTS